MTNLVFVVGILFCLVFVISPSEEIKVFPPARGSTFVVAPGTARVEIAWTFNDKARFFLVIRQWLFITTTELLAEIIEEKNVKKYHSSLPEFEIVKPATLLLKNIDGRYNGTYEFCVVVWSTHATIGRSYVSVFVEAKPNVTINCSSSTTVNVGDDIMCLCKGEGGNPPANVTWYKDGVQVDFAGNEEKMLTINDVNKTASGTYKCVGQSYSLRDEKSIEISVHQKATFNKSNSETGWISKVGSILLGIFIGVILSYIFAHSRRKFRNWRKPHSSYQDLDASKMTSNDRYQSLRSDDSEISDGDYVNQNYSIYAKLNKERDVDNKYQSLT